VVNVNVSGVVSPSTLVFTVPKPQITSVTPNTGTVGTQITVTGSGFHATRGSGSLSYSNGQQVQIVSWTDTQIVGTVTSAAGSGTLSVFQNSSSNSDVRFNLINPVITSLSPTLGPVGTQVTIGGSGFGATQGSSTVRFGGANPAVVSWSDSQIVVSVPANAATSAVSLLVSGIASNQNLFFTVPAPKIISISPSSGTVGSNMTISGSGFQALKGTSSVYFNNAATTAAVSWSDNQVVVAVPPGASTGTLKVQANNGQSSNLDFVFTTPNHTVTRLTPSSAGYNAPIQISGNGFGTTQGSSSVTFSTIGPGIVPANVVSWSDTQIVALVPGTAISGPVQVTAGGVPGNSNVYFNVPAPLINALTPNVGGAGNLVTITGSGFGPSANSNISYVGFPHSMASIRSWSDTQIIAVVPSSAVTGSINVITNAVSGNYVMYTIPNLSVATLTPTNGPVGTSVTVAGVGFGSSQGTSTLKFNGQQATVNSWSDIQIVATVPVTATTGPVAATVNNINSNATVNFAVPTPQITVLQPFGGIAGTSVTVFGGAFQAAQRDSTLTLNGSPLAVSSWSDSQIVTTVPTGAASGPFVVTVNGISSQSLPFEVPNPVVTSIDPPEAPVGGTVTIYGSGFGAGVGEALFNGNPAGVVSWSDTKIVAIVPYNATSGTVSVAKFDATSNTIPFSVEGLPTVASVSPSSGQVGSTVTISGSGFGSAQRASSLSFNGAPAFVSAWSDTSLTAVVPPGATTGPVNVAVTGVTGPTSNFRLTNSVQVTDSLGRITSYQFEQTGGKWHFLAMSGYGCSSCTDERQVTFHGGSTAHDDSGDTTTSTDELTHQTTFVWDGDHNLLSQSTPLDSNTTVTSSYTYNSFGEPLTVTDPLGNVTTNTYDPDGNLLTVTSPQPDANTAASATTFTYDTKGQLTQITDPLSHHTTLAYYPTGLINTITDHQGNVTTYQYDLRGNRMSVTDAANNITSFTYDLGNRLTKITYPDTTFVTFGYDTRGRRTSVTDQNGKITTYAYDDADRLTSVTDAALNVTQYAYDTEDELLGITDAAQHTTSFVYDSQRRVTQTVFPSTLTENYDYDVLGNLTSKTDRKNQTILYIYDALNRLTHKGYPDATGVDYIYDLAGKIKQVSNPTGVYGFAYDNMGRPVGSTTQYAFLPGQTYSNAYTYDAASNRTGFTAPDGSTVAYVYDTLGRLATLTDSQTGQFGFSYDALSRRTGLTRPNGVNTSYNFDSLSRLASVLHKAGTNTLDGAGYAYDNAGNRTGKTNYLNNITEQYTYDPLYQLTQVTQGLTTTESYAYDPVGNRLSSLGMSPYAYNSSNELTSTPSATFIYDNSGNTTSKADGSGTTGYTWDFENRLTAVTLPGTAGTVSFKYDPFGRRIQKSSSTGTTNYLYEGSNTVADLDGTGNLVARYTQGAGIDEPLAQLRSGTVGYYDQDGLGSVTTLSGATGTIGNSYTYDSFGNLSASTGSSANPFQYTGRDFDPETGLRYYRARYYSADTGRFLSEDTIRFDGGNDFYPYVNNSPTNFVDPLGMQAGMAQAQLIEHILHGDEKVPCGKDCLKGKILDIQKALGKPGCMVLCSTVGLADDVALPAATLLWRRLRVWAATATGKTVLKFGGTCGIVAGVIVCTYECDVWPPPHPAPVWIPWKINDFMREHGINYTPMFGR
jgi:RHS repeat-associated protein